MQVLKYIDGLESGKVVRQPGVSLSEQAETERSKLLASAKEKYQTSLTVAEPKAKPRSRSSSSPESASRRGSESKKRRSSKSRSPYSGGSKGRSGAAYGGGGARSKPYR